MIKLLGDYGEGGGSIVRIALALSALTCKPFEIDSIRKGRTKSGLKAQHLYCIQGCKELCNAKVEGMQLGSEYLKFEPSEFKSRNLKLDIGTAGSITLALQSLLMPSILGNKSMKIELTGGTDVSWSPSFDYFSNVLLPQLQRFAKVEAKLLKRGYYPKGNGKVGIKISPKFKLDDFSDFNNFCNHLKQNISPFNLTEQHYLIQVKGISHASKSLENARVAERQAHASQSILAKRFNVPIKIFSEYQDTLSTGSGITLWAIFSKNKEDIDENNPIRLGSDSLGEQGKKAEDVGTEAASELIREIESNAAVDKHLADQILPFMALAGGSIKTSKITSHTKSNIYAIEQFLEAKFSVEYSSNTITL
ncbi:RNA 3'-terminal phosphate cyclase [Candidatus Woesearchaeota archaeon]|nr:RNA 3'-terminal phosphate cyclase [Candidatus Woesearchaeota archaeon]